MMEINEVENWLGKMGSDITKKSYRKWLNAFCDWCQLTPKELLALKDDRQSFKAEQLLDNFVAKSSYTDYQKLNITNTVKSFFKHNYKDLARVCGRVSVAKQKPYRKPTPELLRKFINGAWTIRDKALITFIASTFIRERSIPNLTWGHIEDGAVLQPDCGIDILHVGLMSKELKGKGKGKFKNVQQHTFLTPEAKELLLQYKRWLETLDITITKETPLFMTQVRPYKAVSVETVCHIFKQASKRSGIRFSPHDFRRYGQTQLEDARLPPNWTRKITGHKISGEEAPYSQPKIETLRQAYRKALPHLIFIEKPIISEEDRRIQAIIDNARLLGIPDGDIEQLLKERGRTWHKPSELALRMGALKRKKETETNGGNCGEEYRQIGENELLQYLREGWRITHNLQNGKVIIQKG